MDACRACGAEIVWVTTRKGRPMPLDARPSVKGNVVLQGQGRADVLGGMKLERARDRGETLYVSHFATCPQARTFRR